VEFETKSSSDLAAFVTWRCTLVSGEDGKVKANWIGGKVSSSKWPSPLRLRSAIPFISRFISGCCSMLLLFLQVFHVSREYPADLDVILIEESSLLTSPPPHNYIMPGIVRKLVLFATVDGLVLQPLAQRGQRPSQPVTIDYKTASVRPFLRGSEEQDRENQLECYGVIGIL
jgi:hypothetical protein